MTLGISSLAPVMATQEPLHVKTPLRDSMALSKVAGTSVFLKMDSSQPSGSFKIRGIGHLCKMVQGRVASGQEGQLYLTVVEAGVQIHSQDSKLRQEAGK